MNGRGNPTVPSGGNLALTQNVIDLVILTTNLSEAETSLRGCWEKNYKRIQDGKPCDFSMVQPSIRELIQKGRETANSLKGRGDPQYQGIEELVDSVSALWDSFAEHLGREKIALHNIDSRTQTSSFLAIDSPFDTSRASTPQKNSPPTTWSSGGLRTSTTSSISTTPRTSRHQDPLLPKRRGSDVSTDSENEPDWEIVNNDPIVPGGTPGRSGGPPRKSGYDDDKL